MNEGEKWSICNSHVERHNLAIRCRTRLPENGRYRVAAAIAAGVTGQVCSFEELFDAVMAGEFAVAA
jgi:hypothetical protein